MPDRATLARLASEIDDLGHRLARVSGELRALQSTAADPAYPAASTHEAGQPPAESHQHRIPAPEQSQQAAFTPYSQPLQTAFTPSPQQPGPALQPPPRQSRGALMEALRKEGAGSRLVAWVGGAVTLLGIVLLLVLAIQRGWMGPLPRLFFGAVLGAALIGIGLWLHRKPTGRAGALALAATGIATLYLDVLAVTTLYEYLPPLIGLALGLLIAVGGLWLAAHWGSTLVGVAVIVGCAVCAPIITRGFPPQLVAFLLMVQLAAAPVQLRRRWSTLAVTAGIPPLLASMCATIWTGAPGSGMNTAAALATAAVGLALGLVTAHRRPDDAGALVLVVGAAAPALVAAWLLPRSQAVAVSMGIAVVLLSVWATRRWQPRRAADVAGVAGLVAALQATLVQFDGSTQAVVLLGEALLLALVAVRARTTLALWAGTGFAVLGAALGVSSSLPPTLLLRFSPWPLGALVGGCSVAVLLVAVSLLLPWVALRLDMLRSRESRLLSGMLTAISTLYGSAGVVLSAALLAMPHQAGFLLGHAMVTLSWTLAALALLVRGINVVLLRVFGLVLVAAALAKLMLFDLAALDGVVRVAAFLGAGLVLLTTGTLYARLITAQRTNA